MNKWLCSSQNIRYVIIASMIAISFNTDYLFGVTVTRLFGVIITRLGCRRLCKFIFVEIYMYNSKNGIRIYYVYIYIMFMKYIYIINWKSFYPLDIMTHILLSLLHYLYTDSGYFSILKFLANPWNHSLITICYF